MENNLQKQVEQVLSEMESYFEKNSYKSFDPCDIKALPFILKYYDLFYRTRISKFAIFPLEVLVNKFPRQIRKIVGIHKQAFAQSHALIVRAKLEKFRKLQIEEEYSQAETLFNWILSQRSGMTRNASWGQPYNWFSSDIIPADTPRTTVSSQILHTCIDMYLTGKKETYRELIGEICRFFLIEMVRSYDSDDETCFAYTLVDNYRVHNANMMAASALMRAGTILKDDEIIELAGKCLNFTLRRQNPDGSWFYYADDSGGYGKIDHYHTGYVLEALSVIRNLQGDTFRYEKEFEKGVDFYLEQLFTGEGLPKMTPASTYPIDIQSCAQSIITLAEFAKFSKGYQYRIENVINFTLEKFYHTKGYFSYRINKNGKILPYDYIRWGDAWMYLALSRYVTLFHYV